MSISDELFEIAVLLENQSKILKNKEFDKPLQKLIDASKQVGEAWSGSWLGYQSRVYYANLVKPPSSARFSQEWGMKAIQGDWREFQYDDIIRNIQQLAGNPDIHKQEKQSFNVKDVFEDSKSKVLSLFSIILGTSKNDRFLQEISEEVKRMEIHSFDGYIEAYRPQGPIMSRDTRALGECIQVPPHIFVQAQVLSIKHPFIACDELSKLIRKGTSHMQNIEKYKGQEKHIGTKIFIGHGQSPVWRELKDFIQDRLLLDWDEFERIPVAGYTNIERLSQMLDDATFALLILTAEDEQKDGKIFARQNVIHESGLFQGRIGFKRAIILLEEGCEEFSNIHGLEQIRFPKENISAVFEKIRRVLEREGLLKEI